MQRSGDTTLLSATDLSTHADCERRTYLELGVLAGRAKRPGMNEIERRMLAKRGHEHEARVLEHYRRQGLCVTEVSQAADAAQATLDAMRAGADVIYQGTLRHGRWLGRPDFLLKVERPCPAFGGHSYEVADAKLARETKARALLQLCAYTAWLGELQGAPPERLWLIPFRDEIAAEPFRAADYMALFRRAQSWFESFVASEPPLEPAPEPVEHCDVCAWWKSCEDRRRQDDHLSLVAGITRRQRDRLELAGVTKLLELGRLARDTPIDGIGADALARIREQARLQVEARQIGEAQHELLLDAESGTGLERLPEPSPGDVFLDLEGDSFVLGDGLEYLFGLLELHAEDDPFSFETKPAVPEYHAAWAVNRAEEKLAFERVIDRIKARRSEWPGMHVYHFGHREADALKKLACRHATREEVVDDLLRSEALVDLHRVVRHGIRASVEGYTLKQLEALHGFERRVPTRDAAAAMQWFGWWLETGDRDVAEAELRATIERYNEDDCVSTWRLRDWLEQERSALGRHRPLVRPAAPDKKPSEERERASQEVAAVAAALHARAETDPAHAARLQLLADLLDWHWREAKSGWWEYFRARDVPGPERQDDRAVLGGLRYVGPVGRRKRSVLHRYEFPPQEHAIRQGHRADNPDSDGNDVKSVEVVALSDGQLIIAVGDGREPPRLSALIPSGPIPTKAHQERLLELGKWVAEHGMNAEGPFRAARDLLSSRSPRIAGEDPGPLLRAGEDAASGVTRLALGLDRSTLAVQGPPGSGKTHCAALTILALVESGRRVAVTANSHRVILGVLKRVYELARDAKPRLLHIGEEDDLGGEDVPFELSDKHKLIAERLRRGQLDVVGGTSWALCREDFAGLFDVLLVDEAGQLSLANVLAAAHAAHNLVMVGDPAQLEQPQKGVHPGAAGASALEHLLGDHVTLPADRGVFLPHTRRLHPSVCRFTSEVFYDGKLEPAPVATRQKLSGSGVFDAPGLRFVGVDHRGNGNHAEEEIERIAALVGDLLGSGVRFEPGSGAESRILGARDVLVIAPYNAQVAALRRRLPDDVAVGTVDKFQGAEAPVVIYSMTSSSADDAPRGLEFLYSLNRLNVATSRAQALVIVVGSPRLGRAHGKTPRQMKLVNALCRYLELARENREQLG